MPVRALIVVLLALNLGVAAWWLLRPDAPRPPVPASTAGGVPLKLVSTSRPEPAAPAPVTADGAAGQVQCLRAGPFVDPDAVAVVRTVLQDRVLDAVIEEIPGTAAGYRVILPPAADRAAAEEAVERLSAAGFQDLLVIGPGPEAHAVALGAYRSRQGAEQRLQALRAAGFAAQLRAQGRGEPSRWWLELRTRDADAVRARLAGIAAVDCQLPWAPPPGGAPAALR